MEAINKVLYTGDSIFYSNDMWIICGFNLDYLWIK